MARLDQHFINLPHTEQAVVLADGLPFVCLVVTSNKPLSTKEKSDIKHKVDLINQKLSSYEKVRAIISADEIFSVTNETVTNNLKIKRGNIAKRYDKKISTVVKDKSSELRVI